MDGSCAKINYWSQFPVFIKFIMSYGLELTYAKLNAMHLVLCGWATSIRPIRKHQRDISKHFSFSVQDVNKSNIHVPLSTVRVYLHLQTWLHESACSEFILWNFVITLKHLQVQRTEIVHSAHRLHLCVSYVDTNSYSFTENINWSFKLTVPCIVIQCE